VADDGILIGIPGAQVRESVCDYREEKMNDSPCGEELKYEESQPIKRGGFLRVVVGIESGRFWIAAFWASTEEGR